MSDWNDYSIGLNILGIVQFILFDAFILLKVIGVIESWWIVFIPILVYIGILVALVVIAIIIALCKK